MLHDAASPEPGDDAEAAKPGEPAEPALAGLHAKLYVADAGWNATVWTGSANATDAAFGGNVEFLVELTGKKSRCGIDAVLGSREGNAALAALLHPYTPDQSADLPDPAQAALEEQVSEVRRYLLDRVFRLSPDLYARVRASGLFQSDN